MFIGVLYLFLTFAVCFILVHILKLAFVGLKSFMRKPQKSEPEPEKKKEPQPVYYLVEKRRARKNYSEPREIEFK